MDFYKIKFTEHQDNCIFIHIFGVEHDSFILIIPSIWNLPTIRQQFPIFYRSFEFINCLETPK